MAEQLTREEIDKRLARLRGEVPVPAEDQPAPEPETPFDLDAWIASRVQPENEEEPNPFVVGWTKNSYGEWEALPPFRWPNPGAPMTKELYMAQGNEQMLRNDAAQELTSCVRLLAGKLRYGPDYWSDPFQGTPCELFEKRWAYLTGLWRARGITIPDDATLQKWASESRKTRRDAQEQTT